MFVKEILCAEMGWRKVINNTDKCWNNNNNNNNNNNSSSTEVQFWYN